MLASDVTLTVFNMEDPVVGGYSPEKVALRRAIGLAPERRQEIRAGTRKGQAIPAQSPLAPNTYGYDPAFRSENGLRPAARARRCSTRTATSTATATAGASSRTARR